MLYPWHQAAHDHVLALVQQGRLPTTTCLVGQRGWGTERLLNVVVKALLTIADERDVAEIAHPDLFWMAPEGAEIKIAQARALNEFAYQTPQIAPVKAIGIADAHRLNPAAANALLKTLEEPPLNTRIVLATDHWSRLLPTIRSRCMRINIAADESLARSWLAAQGGDDSVNQLDAGPLQVRNVAGLDAWLQALLQGSVGELVGALPGEPVDVLDAWYRRLRTLVAAALGGDGADTAGAARAYLNFGDELLHVRRQLTTTNSANERLLLESLVVAWRRLPVS